MFIEAAKVCEACLQSTSGQCAEHMSNVTIVTTGGPGMTLTPFRRPFVPQGWQCPCCHHVMAPHVNMCPVCPVPLTLTYTTTSSLVGTGG